MDAKVSSPVISILNLKGGVGKTHTSWILASVCQERDRRMLAIDLDTQGNLSNSLLNGQEPVPGVEMLFHPAVDADPDVLIRHTAFSAIDLVPASSRLARFDVSDQAAWEKADLHLSLVEALAALRGRYDYILLDCPPRLSLVSFAAPCASDFVLIPLEAADWGAQGIVQVAAAIEYVRERFNPRLQLLGSLVSRFKQARAYQQSYLKQLRGHFGVLAFDSQSSGQWPEAPCPGRTLFTEPGVESTAFPAPVRHAAAFLVNCTTVCRTHRFPDEMVFDAIG